MAQEKEANDSENHVDPPEESLANTQHVASEMAKAFQELAKFV